MSVFEYPTHSIEIIHDDSMNLYDTWKSPTVIVSDGPYGVKGFKGDLFSSEGLDKWYEPHIKQWTEKSTPQTTLWFWCTEVGWATVHHVLDRYGWEYRACNVWDKGIQHVAGNTNTQSLRQLPVVTEICIHYIKKPIFNINGNGSSLSMKDWLRHEWKRTGLPFSKTNDAAGVKNAATRKWFTDDWLWYMPPAESFEKLAEYANEYGVESGKPYFSMDGKKPLSKSEWEKQRAKFYCPIGVTNVWAQPPVNGIERIKNGLKAVHLNQKPLNILKMLIEISSDKGDLVWEPFGGLCTGAIASHELKRSYVATEINKEVYDAALKRFRKHISVPRLL